MSPRNAYSAFSRVTGHDGATVEALITYTTSPRSSDETEPDIVIGCFAGGTPIATPRGPIRVERLCEGDLVITNLGRAQPILRIGKRRWNLSRCSSPEKMRPVRIASHAFGEGRPQRPLYLPPDHAIFIEDTLIAVKDLINGSTITQTDVDWLIYYYLELIRGEPVPAQGPPTETEITDGNHAVIVLHPQVEIFETRVNMTWPGPDYAPGVNSHAQMSGVIAGLARQAQVLDYKTSSPKKSGIRTLWRLFWPGFHRKPEHMPVSTSQLSRS